MLASAKSALISGTKLIPQRYEIHLRSNVLSKFLLQQNTGKLGQILPLYSIRRPMYSQAHSNSRQGNDSNRKGAHFNVRPSNVQSHGLCPSELSSSEDEKSSEGVYVVKLPNFLL